MKQALRKHLTLSADYETDIEIDRRLLCDIMSKFNDFFVKIFEMEEEKEKLKGKEQDSESENGTTGVGVLLKLLEAKYPDIYICYDEYTETVARYALPKLISRADENLTAAQAKTKADELFSFAEENDAVGALSTGLMEFIFEGFTTVGNEEKPKIQITIA